LHLLRSFCSTATCSAKWFTLLWESLAVTPPMEANPSHPGHWELVMITMHG
jgi:hypothetical protein